MHRKVITPAVALATLALLVWLAYEIVKPFLVAIGWAVMITVVTFPLYQRLRRKLWGRSGPAATLMVLGTLFVLVGPATLLTSVLGRQAADVYPKLEQLASRENPLIPVKEALDRYEGHPVLGDLAGRVRNLLPSHQEIRASLPGILKKGIGFVTGMLTAALSNAAAFLVNLFLTLAALGIFYLQGESLLERVTALLPLPGDQGRELMARLGTVAKGVVRGVVLTCVAQGILGGLGWWVVGLPSPLLFGTIMAFGALVPIVGTAAVWLPGALYLLLTGKTIAGVGLILWGAVAVGNIDNVLRPLLAGGDIGIPMPLLIVGMLGGVISFGLTGLFLGPLALAALLFFFEEHSRAASDEEAPPTAAG